MHGLSSNTVLFGLCRVLGYVCRIVSISNPIYGSYVAMQWCVSGIFIPPFSSMSHLSALLLQVLTELFRLCEAVKPHRPKVLMAAILILTIHVLS